VFAELRRVWQEALCEKYQVSCWLWAGAAELGVQILSKKTGLIEYFKREPRE